MIVVVFVFIVLMLFGQQVGWDRMMVCYCVLVWFNVLVIGFLIFLVLKLIVCVMFMIFCILGKWFLWLLLNVFVCVEIIMLLVGVYSWNNLSSVVLCSFVGMCIYIVSMVIRLNVFFLFCRLVNVGRLLFIYLILVFSVFFLFSLCNCFVGLMVVMFVLKQCFILMVLCLLLVLILRMVFVDICGM